MEPEILNTVVQKVNELSGMQCEVVESGKTADAKIVFRKEGYQKAFYVEVKTKIVPAQLAKLKNQYGYQEPYILVAEYITPQAKKMLKDEQINYIDTAGNIYLNDKGIYVYIETNKTNRSKLAVGNRAFNKAGLKVVYQFLIHPEYINKPYRFIGEQATVTIDTVRRVIHDLLKEKFIVQEKDKWYQFLDRTRLFHEWVTAFNKNLRPKLKQTRYQWLDRTQNWKNVDLPEQAYWSGAVAAERLTDYLIADNITIYTSRSFQELMKKLKIIPDSKGTITLMEQFWKNDENDKFTHPILTYADLINEGDPRYIEAANKIYKQHVETKL